MYLARSVTRRTALDVPVKREPKIDQDSAIQRQPQARFELQFGSPT